MRAGRPRLSRNQLADRMDIPRSALTEYLTKNRRPRWDALDKIAVYFEADAEQLHAMLDLPADVARAAEQRAAYEAPPRWRRGRAARGEDVWVYVPRIDERLSAGPSVGGASSAGEWIRLPEGQVREGPPMVALFTATGDCMREKVEAGDELWVDARREYRDGDLVAVAHAGELLVKRIRRLADGWALVAEDGTIIRPDGDTRVRGVVLKIVKIP